MKLKHWLIYFGVFGVGFACFLIMLFVAESPEQLILGEWVEQSWVYERLNNKGERKKYTSMRISNEKKRLISEDLIIHEAEVWKFLPFGKLKLIGNNKEKNVSWKLKGRGNILKLIYKNEKIERYIITELTQNTLIINVEFDIEAKGIAKLTFKRK